MLRVRIPLLAVLLLALPAVTGVGSSATALSIAADVVDIDYTPDGTGHWLTYGNGTVVGVGNAPDHGHSPTLVNGETVASLSPTPTGRGYWLFTTQGRVHNYGDAGFFQDLGSLTNGAGVPIADLLNGPVVGSAATPTGSGYWLVASDGGIFAFGDARFYGSMGGSALNAPVIGIAPTATNAGYWLVASDGGIFAFGDAEFYGSMGSIPLNGPVTGVIPQGNGYMMVASDGGIFAFGATTFLGSLGGQSIPRPIVTATVRFDKQQYLMVDGAGTVYRFPENPPPVTTTAPPVTTTAPVTPTTTTVPDGPVAGNGIEWPKFGADTNHTGTVGDPTITASNAATLGLDWQANTGGAVFSSPVVVRDPSTGAMLVIVGNQSGALTAYDADSGDRIWTFNTNDDITGTATVDGSILYVGSSNYEMYAVDLATGTEICSFQAEGQIIASPLVHDPDGAGPVGKLVYFGDIGITGADDGGTFWAMNAVDASDPAADCTLRWVFRGFGEPAGSAEISGSWSSPSIGRTSDGTPILVFGGSSPDNAIYGVNAITGNRVWRYQAQVFAKDNDVGASPNVFDAGFLGFEDGVAFVAGKNRIVHALNLADGTEEWTFSIRDDAKDAKDAVRSTMSFDGTHLFLGFGDGVYKLDARTGTKIWRSDEYPGNAKTAEQVTIPVIAGPPGDQVVFGGDLFGRLFGYSAQTGEELWRFSTGSFIYGSSTVANSRLYAVSSNGFLYAFRPGGAPPGRPSTTITSPSDDAVIDNPDGDLVVRGTATDATCVDRVVLSIKNKITNRFWDADSATWIRAFVQFSATLSNPRATSTNWSARFPVPFEGSQFFVQAEAIDCLGNHDPQFPTVDFFIPSLGNPPETRILSPVFKQIFNPPDATDPDSTSWPSFPITIRGDARDTTGTNRGVVRVRVVVYNIEHGEYYCGSDGCGTGGHSDYFRGGFRTVDATLSNPGGVNTDWTLTFPVYDHIHKYRIVAWAVDKDGEEDSTRAEVARICTRPKNDRNCA